MKYIAYTTSHPPSLLRKVVALAVTAAVAAAVLMFSAVVLVVLLVLGLIVAAWVWWKTRELRKMMKQFRAQAANDAQVFREGVFRAEPPHAQGFGGESAKGEIIEGEAVRVHEPRDGNRR